MKNKGLVLALATMVISGVSVFTNAQLVKGMDPIVQTTIKNGLVGILIIGWMFSTKKLMQLHSLTCGEWVRLAIIALVGGSISFGLFFTGLKMTGAVEGSLIQKSMVIWIVLMAFPLLKEKISPWLAMAAVGLYGVNFIGGIGFKSFNVGHLMVLAATLLWSGEALLVKKYIRSMDTDLLLFGRMVLGSSLLFAYMMATGKMGLIASISAIQWQGLLLVSLLLFGYVMTWYRALRYASAVYVSSILVGATVITTTLTSLATGKISIIQLIQSFLISGIVSVILLSLKTLQGVQNPLVGGIKQQNRL